MKINTFQKIIKKNGLDAAVFLNSDENKRDKNIFYFAGVDPEFCCLVVPKDKNSFLIIGSLDEEMVKKESKIEKIILFEKRLKYIIEKEIGSIKKIGVNFSKFTLAEKKIFKGIKFYDISKEIINLRIEKENNEISKIKNACKITDNIFSLLIKNFKFKTEKEIEEFIEKEAKTKGCKLAFPTIVASGKNSSMPHYQKNNSKLQKGFCVIDFGVNYKGYNSDMTRTIYIGKPSSKDINEYYKLLDVQQEAIKQLGIGIDYMKVHKGVKKVLGDAFIHGLGHGLGIDVHEPISINNKNLRLKENTVLTVEPGVYYPNKYGIRIEDDILITKKGPVVLTKSRKYLIVINN